MPPMKMKVSELVVVVSCVLCVSADDPHEDVYISGCSDSDSDKEGTMELDGEVMMFADFVNKRKVEPQPSFIDPLIYEDGTYEAIVSNIQICRHNLLMMRQVSKDVPLIQDPPSSLMIYTRDDVELGEKNVLICHVTGFYPAPVKVHWTKNGEKVTEGTNITMPSQNKDGSFTQISRLDFVPEQGDIYNCAVEHPALKEPLTRFWDVEVQQPSVGPAVFCGLGLTVGLLGVAAGTFFLIKGKECK